MRFFGSASSLPSFRPAVTPLGLPSCLSAFLPPFLPSFLPSFLRSFLPSLLHLSSLCYPWPPGHCLFLSSSTSSGSLGVSNYSPPLIFSDLSLIQLLILPINPYHWTVVIISLIEIVDLFVPVLPSLYASDCLSDLFFHCLPFLPYKNSFLESISYLPIPLHIDSIIYHWVIDLLPSFASPLSYGPSHLSMDSYLSPRFLICSTAKVAGLGRAS